MGPSSLRLWVTLWVTAFILIRWRKRGEMKHTPRLRPVQETKAPALLLGLLESVSS